MTLSVHRHRRASFRAVGSLLWRIIASILPKPGVAGFNHVATGSNTLRDRSILSAGGTLNPLAQMPADRCCG